MITNDDNEVKCQPIVTGGKSSVYTPWSFYRRTFLRVFNIKLGSYLNSGVSLNQ